ncbi:MAG: cation diffusion facilitator family transporter [Actinomycetota bacterium]|jgi:cobalt-zinc-cadmium efflux system protein|nr:cation diffusion facilitator family transporter [Actinomycetota bacterium]
MGHDHAHHHHDHNHQARSRTLAVTLGANGILLVAMIIGGVLFGSLALWADAAHQATDVIGLFVAALAFRAATRPGDTRYTYGLKRVEVLGALTNAVLLVASALWIGIEAIRRLGDEPDIEGLGVIVLALVALVINGAGALGLRRHAGNNLNLRAAVAHLTIDALGSFVVLIVGISVQLWDATWTDPVASLLLAALVLHSGWRLLSQATSVLLEAAPGEQSADSLAEIMSAHPDVEDVHHVHVWSIDSETAALTAHVVVDSTTLHQAQRISRDLERVLEACGIEHSTLSLECHMCEEPLHR